jgi:hypothetical protein
LEKLNKPTVTICSNKFYSLGEMVRKNLGLPNLPIVIITHPIGGLKEAEVIAKADAIVDQIIQALTA